MRLLGCGLLAGAGVWSGLLAARRASEETSRCGGWCRMLELMAFELERFRTPLPDLLASLAARLDGVTRRFCEGVSLQMTEGAADLRSAWKRAAEELPEAEGEILRPLGDVLGQFGAEEQTAALASARTQMERLWQTRQNSLRERQKVRFGVLCAGGIVLAIILV